MLPASARLTLWDILFIALLATDKPDKGQTHFIHLTTSHISILLRFIWVMIINFIIFFIAENLAEIQAF